MMVSEYNSIGRIFGAVLGALQNGTDNISEDVWVQTEDGFDTLVTYKDAYSGEPSMMFDNHLLLSPIHL